MSNLQDGAILRPWQIGVFAVGAWTEFALGTAPLVWSDTPASRSGQAIAWRFVAPATTTTVRVAVYVSGYAGTPGALTMRLCAYGTGVAIPGNLISNGSVTAVPAGAGTWLLFTFAIPPANTLGNVYWLVLGDGGWTTGNTASILARSGGLYALDGMGPSLLSAYTSTVGFSVAGTAVATPPVIAIEFGNGAFLGQSHTNVANYTSNTLERGLKIVGLTETLLVSGMAAYIGTNVNSLKCYAGATLPGGTIYSGFNGGAAMSLTGGQAAIGAAAFGPCTLVNDTLYRFALGASAAHTGPQYSVIEGYAAAVAAGFGPMLLGCAPFGGRVCGCISDGGTPAAWVDSPQQLPRMALIVRDQVPITRPAEADVWFGSGQYGADGIEKTPAKRASSIANCEAAKVKKDVVIDNVTGSLESTDPGQDNVLKDLPYKIESSSHVGTFNEAGRNTDPGVAHVEAGIAYKIGNDSKEGIYDPTAPIVDVLASGVFTRASEAFRTERTGFTALAVNEPRTAQVLSVGIPAVANRAAEGGADGHLKVMCSNNNYLFAVPSANANYIWRSADGTTGWARANTVALSTAAASLFATSTGRLVATGSAKVWYSDDNGETWTQCKDSLGADVALSNRPYPWSWAEHHGVILMATYGLATEAAQIWRSADDGVTWDKMFELPAGYVDHFHAVGYQATAQKWIADSGDGGANWLDANSYFTVTVGQSLITISGHSVNTGARVYFRTTGTLPAPLALNTKYYLSAPSSSTLRVHTTYADALAQTNPIVFTDAGTGTHCMFATQTLTWVSADPEADLGSWAIYATTPGPEGFDVKSIMTQKVKFLDYGHGSNLLFGSDGWARMGWLDVINWRGGSLMTRQIAPTGTPLTFCIFRHGGLYYASMGYNSAMEVFFVVASANLQKQAVFARFIDALVYTPCHMAGYKGGNLHLLSMTSTGWCHTVMAPAKSAVRSGYFLAPPTTNTLTLAQSQAEITGITKYPAGLTIANSSDSVRPGGQSIHITGTPGINAVCYIWFDYITVVPGDVIQGHIWVKGSGKHDFNMRICGLLNTTELSYLSTQGSVRPDGEWEEFWTCRYVVPATGNRGRFYLVLYGSAHDGTVDLYIDAPELLKNERCIGRWNLGQVATAGDKLSYVTTLPSEWTHLFSIQTLLATNVAAVQNTELLEMTKFHLASYVKDANNYVTVYYDTNENEIAIESVVAGVPSYKSLAIWMHREEIIKFAVRYSSGVVTLSVGASYTPTHLESIDRGVDDLAGAGRTIQAGDVAGANLLPHTLFDSHLYPVVMTDGEVESRFADAYTSEQDEAGGIIVVED